MQGVQDAKAVALIDALKIIQDFQIKGWGYYVLKYISILPCQVIGAWQLLQDLSVYASQTYPA